MWFQEHWGGDVSLWSLLLPECKCLDASSCFIRLNAEGRLCAARGQEVNRLRISVQQEHECYILT